MSRTINHTLPVCLLHPTLLREWTRALTQQILLPIVHALIPLASAFASSALSITRPQSGSVNIALPLLDFVQRALFVSESFMPDAADMIRSDLVPAVIGLLQDLSQSLRGQSLDEVMRALVEQEAAWALQTLLVGLVVHSPKLMYNDSSFPG